MTNPLLPHDKPVLNRFAQFDTSEEEQIRGAFFTTENIWYLQNKLAEEAVLKSALLFDPADAMTYAQQESFHAGQIKLLEFLIANSTAAGETLMAQAANRTE